MLIDQCIIQPASKKLPPAIDQNKYREPKQDKCRVRGIGTFCSILNVYTKFPSSELRKLCRKRDRKIVRAREDGEHEENKAF